MKIALNDASNLKHPIIYDSVTHHPIAYIEKKADYWDDKAEFIVRAVNAHDALVEALENIISIYEDDRDDDDYASWRMSQIAEDALSAAKGGKP